ncbi:hypothetical protein GCM10022280_12440 [Sphingomonas swuensis]|uniref:Uncharacterized protein n=1 Tax=Sphingomonas swuensis TaxID=977800 RepID=A0ABP7SQX4_9SPHN
MRLYTRLGAVSVVAASLLALALALAYITAAYPYQDDFCFTLWQRSPAETANWFFTNWSGRWSAMFLYAAMASGHDYAQQGMGALVWWSLPLWLAGFFFLAALVMRGAGAAQRGAAALVLLVLFWTSTPGALDLFYWTAGVSGYSVPFALSCLSLFLLAVDRPAWASGIGAIVAAAVPTFNELAGIVLVPVLALLAVDRWRRNRSFMPLLVALVLTLLASAVVIFAAGTAQRLDAQVETEASLLGYAAKLFRPYDSAFASIVDPRLLCLLLVAACSTRFGASPNPRRAIPVLALGLVAALAGNAAYIAAAGTVPSYRVLGYGFAVMLSATAAAAWHLRGTISNKGLEAASLIALAALIVTGPNTTMALHDLPKLAGFKAEQRAF